tara:strand:+ start:1374 stop:1580 length:207 start_codon:yes stop_codon:yes gene_type:complete
MKTVKIQDTKYIRDINSKAVLNTNRNALEQYKLERQRREAEKNDINRMKEDIVELKKMIKKLLGKQNG